MGIVNNHGPNQDTGSRTVATLAKHPEDRGTQGLDLCEHVMILLSTFSYVRSGKMATQVNDQPKWIPFGSKDLLGMYQRPPKSCAKDFLRIFGWIQRGCECFL